MSPNADRPAGRLSRRALLTGVLAAVSAIGMAGCATVEQNAPDAADAGDSAKDAAIPSLVDGGTFTCGVARPTSIEPRGIREDQDIQVCNALFDALTAFDYEQRTLVGKAATSWGANEDATEFTFHLREGATFHNGDPVTSKDFAFAWDRLCDPGVDSGYSSRASRLLMPVEGYDDRVAGKKGARLAVECPDDYTLVVKLSTSCPDFPFMVSHLSTSPVPAASGGDADFATAPVGNGAFRMDGQWDGDQAIRLVKFDGYWADPAHIGGIEFDTRDDVHEAFADFAAGNLDCTAIPALDIASCAQGYGEAPDGCTANPGEQCVLGARTAVFYLSCNNADALLGKFHLRRAISYAVDRQAICDAVYAARCVPADSIVTPDVEGYVEGAWDAARHDADRAVEELAVAREELGLDEISIRLSYGSGLEDEQAMLLIQENLEAAGIGVELVEVDGSSYLRTLDEGDYQIAGARWTPDYPLMDGFLFPLFFGEGPNRCLYSDPHVDAALLEARSTLDDVARIEAMQRANERIARDLPVIPILFLSHSLVCSDRVNDLHVDHRGLIDFSRCWLSA